MLVARLFVQPGVIGKCTKAFVTQIRGERIDRTAAEAINNAAVILSFFKIIEKLIVGFPLRLDRVENIRSVKAGYKNLGVLEY